MKYNPTNFLTPSVAILLGSLIVAIAILISGGVIPLKIASKSDDLAIKGGVVSPTQAAQPPAQVTPDPKKVKPLSADDHIRGDKSARIVMITYSDLECPFCKRFHETALQVFENFTGQIVWVYRHFPLSQIHKQAKTEAMATECVARLGGDSAFWKMVDKIYEVTPGNDGLDLTKLPDYAQLAGVDRVKFQTCLDNKETATKVDADQQGGATAGVQGTPASFIFDTKSGKSIVIPGALPFEQIKQQIDALLKG